MTLKETQWFSTTSSVKIKKKKSKLNIYRFQKSKTSITIIFSDLNKIDDRHLILKEVQWLFCTVFKDLEKNGEKRKEKNQLNIYMTSDIAFL